jgi:pimeloyl-ACP methyl ester carboxylesterase
MGSATALSYAAQHAGAVRAMVLFNTLTTATYSAGLLGPLRSLPRRAPSLVSRMSNIALGSRLGKVAVRAQLGRDGIARRVHDRADLHALYERSSQSRSLLAVLEDIPSYAALDRFEPPDDFPPIFSIWGLDNRVLPARVGRTLMKTLRPARQEWFERCGHLAMLERPEAIAELILDFFAATAGSEPSDA